MIVPLLPGTLIVTLDSLGNVTVSEVTAGTIEGVSVTQLYQGTDRFAAAQAIFKGE